MGVPDAPMSISHRDSTTTRSGSFDKVQARTSPRPTLRRAPKIGNRVCVIDLMSNVLVFAGIPPLAFRVSSQGGVVQRASPSLLGARDY